MAIAQHKDAPLGHRHANHDWSVASGAARAALPVVPADVGKDCMQTDTNPPTFWRLARVTGGVVWLPLGGAGITAEQQQQITDALAKANALSTQGYVVRQASADLAGEFALEVTGALSIDWDQPGKVVLSAPAGGMTTQQQADLAAAVAGVSALRAPTFIVQSLTGELSGERALEVAGALSIDWAQPGKVVLSAPTAAALASSAPATITKATAVPGVSTEAARADHKHDVATAAPASLSAATTTSAEGSATSLARSDHAHAVPTAAPAALTVGAAATAGTSTNLARADHVHAVAAGTPVAVGAANAAGSATTFARSDHVHDASAKADVDFGIVTNAAASLTLGIAHRGKLILCTYNSAPPKVVLPRNSTVALPLGFTCSIVLYGSSSEGYVAIESELMTGTYGVPERQAARYSILDSTPYVTLASPSQIVTVIKIAADVWLVTGHYVAP